MKKMLIVSLLISAYAQVDAMNATRARLTQTGSALVSRCLQRYGANKADFKANPSKFVKAKMADGTYNFLTGGLIGGTLGSVASGLALCIVHPSVSHEVGCNTVFAGGYAGAYKVGGIPGLVGFKVVSDIWPFTAQMK